MHPTPELNLLISACQLYLDISKFELWQKATDNPAIDWTRVAALAAHHQIRPILHEALRQYKPQHLPQKIDTELADCCKQMAWANLSRLNQLNELTQQFAAKNIDLVLHKGGHYASFYKSLSHREFGDIDVFVKEENIEKATDTMKTLGYALYHDYDSLKNITAIDYHLMFEAPLKSIVELHWKPNILTSFDVFESVETRSINGCNFCVPSPENTAKLMGFHHGQKENWDKLKYLMDKALLEKSSQLVFPNESWTLQAELIEIKEATRKAAENDLTPPLEKLNRWYRKFGMLSGQTRIYLLKAAFGLAVFKIALKLLPHSTFKKWYRKLVAVQKTKINKQSDFKNAAWAVRVVAARWPWRATCLPQALTFKYFFRNDPNIQLKVGVNKSAKGDFQAHAWVEKDEIILIGETSETFVPLWNWE